MIHLRLLEDHILPLHKHLPKRVCNQKMGLKGREQTSRSKLCNLFPPKKLPLDLPWVNTLRALNRFKVMG